MNCKHKDIDKTIQQIDYISQMQNEEIYEEMFAIIKGMALKKDLLDQLQISTSEKDFGIFLNLYAFPTQVREAVKAKFLELQEEQKKISQRIREQVEKTRTAIKGFRSRFDAFTKVGLQHKSEVAKQMNKDNREHLQSLLRQAEKDGTGDYIWDPVQVSKWS